MRKNKTVEVNIDAKISTPLELLHCPSMVSAAEPRSGFNVP